MLNVCVCVFQLHEVYSRLCAQRQVSAVGQGECLSLCSLLESRGIFALKKAKEARLTKVRGGRCQTDGVSWGGGVTRRPQEVRAGQTSEQLSGRRLLLCLTGEAGSFSNTANC